MFDHRMPLSPERWTESLFNSRSVNDGAVIRRKVRDIARHVGRERLRHEIARRGYQAVQRVMMSLPSTRVST